MTLILSTQYVSLSVLIWNILYRFKTIYFSMYSSIMCRLVNLWHHSSWCSKLSPHGCPSKTYPNHTFCLFLNQENNWKRKVFQTLSIQIIKKFFILALEDMWDAENDIIWQNGHFHRVLGLHMYDIRGCICFGAVLCVCTQHSVCSGGVWGQMAGTLVCLWPNSSPIVHVEETADCCGGTLHCSL